MRTLALTAGCLCFACDGTFLAPDNRLTKLSEQATTAAPGGTFDPVAPPACADTAAFYEQTVAPAVTVICIGCHTTTGAAKASRFHLVDGAATDLQTLRDLSALEVNGQPLLLAKPSAAVTHGGGRQLDPKSRAYAVWQSFVTALRACVAGSAPGTPQPMDVGTVTLHRLNAAEYDNTVRDLLGGDTSHPPFAADDGKNSFTNNADALSISPLLFEQYEAAAELLAARAVGNPRIATCNAATDACAQQIIAPFLERAWRRPVTAEEVAKLTALVRVAASAGGTFADGLQLAVKAALLSPHFLFRVELDATAGAHALSPYELASRLSYFLWSSMPDEALFAAAKNGAPEAEVERMLIDAKARALLDNFVAEWLIHALPNAKPDATAFPAFDEALRGAMAEETKRFVAAFLFGDRALPDMLDARFSYVNDRLAQHYGLAPVGSAFTEVTTDARRAGLLGQASILTMTAIATRTSPVRRGEWVLADLLCSAPPPPPPDVPALPTASTTGTIRERMEAHRTNPTCAGCHAEMDPIGFALEHFDGIGRWRDDDAGRAIDATGALIDGRSFDGASALAAVIKNDPRFVRCATEKLFSYALGRAPTARDTPRIDALTASFASSGHRMRALIATLVRDDAFRSRRGELP